MLYLLWLLEVNLKNDVFVWLFAKPDFDLARQRVSPASSVSFLSYFLVALAEERNIKVVFQIGTAALENACGTLLAIKHAELCAHLRPRLNYFVFYGAPWMHAFGTVLKIALNRGALGSIAELAREVESFA